MSLPDRVVGLTMDFGKDGNFLTMNNLRRMRESILSIFYSILFYYIDIPPLHVYLYWTMSSSYSRTRWGMARYT